ncbi:O-antigen ligase family protein, partial [Verrucomicrobia bacterium]|nr:O-antigen ligase family protein [Verrucomicrobiota bacterium]
EKTTGESPPTWNYPITPNEILVYKNAALKKGEPNFKCRLLTIEPIVTGDIQNKNIESIRLKFDESWSLSEIISKMGSRYRIYEDSWRMAKDYKFLGCGSGAWGTVYFLYHDADEVWDAWVHCDWLEYWINFGLLGTAPGFILLALTLIPTRSASSTSIKADPWLNIALNLAIAGCLIHALFDFPLQVISIMHLFVILCAVKMTLKKAADGIRST